jgi:uncharacterized membrane protein YbhN (UPF0104 family)
MLAAGGVCAAWLAGGGAHASLAAAAAADPRLAILAGGGFAVSLAATAFAWRLGFRALGASLSGIDACVRYAAGSLVNTVSPARLGDGLRVALFARTLTPRHGRVLSTAGAVAAIALTRAFAQLVVLGCGLAVGAVPFWPLLGLAGLAAAGAATVLALHRWHRRGPVRWLTEASATVVAQPRLGLGLAGWALLAVAGRVLAATAAVSALGVPHPLVMALAITAALDVTAAFPITPGGIGITSGAIALVLASHGVGLATAAGAGLVFHAVETTTSLTFAGSSFALAGVSRVGWRPSLRVASFAAVVAASAALATLALDFA